MDNIYNKNFYLFNTEPISSISKIMDIILPRIPKVHSAVDVGCGIGIWLSYLQNHGVVDIFGIDGPWVDKCELRIPLDRFKSVDLAQPLNIERRFDLAISLEVAEHLPAIRAECFVMELTTLADYVLFSAAIPFQGGRNHLNEQWPSYWIDLFRKQGYVAKDWIRPQIWGDQTISPWYRQNLFLFVSRNRVSELQLVDTGDSELQMPIDLVHPEIYLPKVNGESVRAGLGLALLALKSRWIRICSGGGWRG